MAVQNRTLVRRHAQTEKIKLGSVDGSGDRQCIHFNRSPMKNSLLTLAVLSTLTLAAHAAPNDGIVGPYARVEVGQSRFGLSSASPQVGKDDSGKAVKVFGGYRFNENYGVEVGYAALGSFSETVNVSGLSVQQNAKARSIFGAATGRLPLNDSFALQARAGVSFGKVSATNVLPADDSVVGSKTSALIGVGLEYRPTANLALTLNYDTYGKVSARVDASSLVFGLHFWF